MKLQTVNSASLSRRCSHNDPKGRQCRTLVLDAHSGLCPRHLAEQQRIEAADYYPHLTKYYDNFQTAQARAQGKIGRKGKGQGLKP